MGISTLIESVFSARRYKILILILVAIAVLLVVLSLWTGGYSRKVYFHPPPDASDLRYKFDEVSFFHRMFFARLQYFNCIDEKNGIEFAFAMGVGNPADILFTGRSAVFAKIFYPDGTFEYRVSDFPGSNFSGSRKDSTSTVVNRESEPVGQLVQEGEDVLLFRGHTDDGYFAWDVRYERMPPASRGGPKSAWYVWDRVPTRGIVPRGTVSYLGVMTRARVDGWLRVGDTTYQIENGNGYADLYWGNVNFAALTWTWFAYQGEHVDAHLYHNLNNNAGNLRVVLHGLRELVFPRGRYTITFPPRDEWPRHGETGTGVPEECTITAKDYNYRIRIHWRARKTAFVLMDVPFLNFLIRDALTYEMISDFDITVWRRGLSGKVDEVFIAETGRGFSDWTRRLGWFEPHPQRTDQYKTNPDISPENG